MTRPFEGYASVHVKRKGPKEPIYVCEPTPLGFMCGACSNEVVQANFRWRCACGARVVGAIPNWYAEKMRERNR